MKRFIFGLMLCISAACIAQSWSALLQQYRPVMSDETYQIVQKQYELFAKGDAPIIVDPRIKAIPIVENGEELVDLRNLNHARISAMEGSVVLKAHARPEDIDPRARKHSMMRKSVFEALVRMITQLDEIAPHFGYEKGDLQIKLFEGLRDLATQKELFDTKKEAIKKAHPTMTDDEAYTETCKWVSSYRNNVPVHSTGAAMDIHLWSRKAQAFCDMGRFNAGGTVAPTFSEDSRLSDQQKKTRLMFLIAATHAGLTNYSYEYWHYSYGDRYAAFFRQADPTARVAVYGSV